MSEYNGWTNYETWNVALWLDNDQGTEGLMREYAQECYDDAEGTQLRTREQVATGELADRIREYLDENNPVTDASVYSDLLGAALSEVNWREIAEHYIADLDKETEEDDEEEAA